jgi:hypothetical protein
MEKESRPGTIIAESGRCYGKKRKTPEQYGSDGTDDGFHPIRRYPEMESGQELGELRQVLYGCGFKREGKRTAGTGMQKGQTD